MTDPTERPEGRKTLWERLEDWLFGRYQAGEKLTFDQATYAEEEGLDGLEATAHIQSYLRAQRVPRNARGVRRAEPLFFLRRMPGTRTANTVWAVSLNDKVNRLDSRAVGSSFSNDVRAKVLRALRPDLLRIGDISPRNARFAERQITLVLDSALPLLEAAAQGMSPPEGGDEHDRDHVVRRDQ